jgi:solute carrier family 25 (adenine nucleotide translocator) protein 4/5/6/31
MLGWGIAMGLGLLHMPLILFGIGRGVKYKSSIDAFRQIIAKEGTKSLFKHASANILQVIIGVGVLSRYD